MKVMTKKDQPEFDQSAGVEARSLRRIPLASAEGDAVARHEEGHPGQQAGVADDEGHRHGLAQARLQAEHDPRR